MLHQFSASSIIVIGEQDGAQEQRLKQAITVLLDLNATVTRAYLVRASYDGIISRVMLGLVTHDKKESGKLALQMGHAFRALFNTEAHLDVVFLDDESEAKIRKACRAFYHYRARYH